MSNDDTATLEQQALKAAAAWYARLSAGDASALDREQWQAWLDESPLHRRLWASIEAIGEELRSVPAAIALSSLESSAKASRRRFPKFIAALAGIAFTAWIAFQIRSTPAPIEYQTAIGEQRTFPLADGTELTLDGSSLVSVEFTDAERHVELRRGELFVETGADAAFQHRPFRVSTDDGRMTALGTRFGVRREDAATRLAVVDGRVEVQPRAGGRGNIIVPGQSVRFRADGIDPPQGLRPDMVSWIDGRLVVEDLPLATVVTELGRHWPGTIQCEPSVGRLRVSGTLPLNDAARALDILASTHPLRIEQDTGRGIRVMPR